jgi:predicted transcriptional regulator
MNTQKQLTQDVFDGLPAEYRFARVFPCGTAFAYIDVMHGSVAKIGKGYDATNWKNSLIERAAEPAEQLTKVAIHAAIDAGKAVQVWNEKHPEGRIVATADPVSDLCSVDADLTHHVELIDDQIESEKSRLRETIARLEITVRTQAENIAAYQKSLLECNDQCERKDAQLTDAKARIENHVTQAVEYERYIKELDAKCLRLTVQTMADACVCHSDAPEQPRAESEPSNAYDDHSAHQEFIDGLARGAKYTVILLLVSAAIAFLMGMGWVGGAL